MTRPAQFAAAASLLLFSGCADVGATIDRPAAYAVNARDPLGGVGGWDYLAVDPARHHLFVSRGDRVDVMDTTNGAIAATLQGTNGVHGTAIAPGLQRGFTSNGKADSVTEFDLQTLQRVRDIPLTGHRPDAILYDAYSRRVFTFNALSTDASVIDPVSGKEIARIPLDGKPEFGASDNRGHVYVNIEDKSELTEIDSDALKVLHTWLLAGCEEPSGLAIDAAHLRLFSVCRNRVMAITDGAGGRRVATVPIDDGPDAAAFDAQLGLAFSSNGQSGTLTIIQEDDPDHFHVVQSLATQNSARTMALDPATHRLYLSAAKFEAQPAGAQGRPPMVPDSFTILAVGREEGK